MRYVFKSQQTVNLQFSQNLEFSPSSRGISYYIVSIMQSLLDGSCFLFFTMDTIAYGLLGFMLILIVTHLISRIHLWTKPHLKLTQQSQVVITGGCLGIGREMALQIAKLYHCRILIVDFRKDLFSELIYKLEELGAKVQCYQCDLADDTSVQQFITQLNKRNKAIHLFIHNAGIHIPKRALLTTEKQLLHQFKVNFLSPVKILRETINLLEKQNGHIGVVASIVVLAPGGVDVSAYGSTKHALYSYVNSLRQEMKKDNKKVTISMGCPYLIKTGMFHGFKTKLDFLFRQLQPGYVGKRLVKEFIQKKQICYIYEYQMLIFRITSLFPSQFLDLFSINMNVSNFGSIMNKHDHRIKESK